MGRLSDGVYRYETRTSTKIRPGHGSALRGPDIYLLTGELKLESGGLGCAFFLTKVTFCVVSFVCFCVYFFVIVESLVVSIQVQSTVWKDCETTCYMSSYTLCALTSYHVVCCNSLPRMNE